MAVVDMDELLRSEKVDTTQAAEMLGVTRERVSRMCASKELAAFRPGKNWLIPVVAIEDYLRQRFNLAPKPDSESESTPSKRALRQAEASGQ